MADTNLPKFQGKPLIEIPEFIPTINFLEGDFGRAVLDEYRGRTEKDYGNASALKVLSYDGIVKGSNPFAVALVGSIVSQAGLRVATQADLERALKVKVLPLQGKYEDTGLVLRSESEPNEYLARNLMHQVKARNPNAKMPAMIPLSGLELVADVSSPYKLAFKLKDGCEVFYDSSVLNKDGTFSSEDIDKKTGLPSETSNKGNRTLYTINSGLSGLDLYWGLDVYSRCDNLAGSRGDGRVVLVSAEGTAKNLQEYLTQLQTDANRKKAEIDAKFKQAREILLGE
ncbi:MAG: hypothetical protein AABX73_02400 [Nanoarchaeota archaeon]